MGKLVTHQINFSPLPHQDGLWISENPEEAIDLFIKAVGLHSEKKIIVPTRVLGSPVCSAVIPAGYKEFVVNESIVVNIKKGARVQISFLGKLFKSWYEGKTEGRFMGSVIEGRPLVKSSVTSVIIGELVGEDKAQVSLREIFVMMAFQANGAKGNLLVNGAANVFFTPDINGKIRVVRVCRYQGYWRISGYLVNRPAKWHVGDRIFSRQIIARPLPLAV